MIARVTSDIFRILLMTHELRMNPSNVTQLRQLQSSLNHWHDSMTVAIDVCGLIVAVTMTTLIAEIKRRTWPTSNMTANATAAAAAADDDDERRQITFSLNAVNKSSSDA